MLRINVYDPHLQVMYYNMHNVSLSELPSRFNKFVDTFLPVVTDQPLVSMNDYLRSIAKGKNHVCFDDVLVAGKQLIFYEKQINLGFEPMMTMLKNRVLSNTGFDPHAKPTKHTITVIKKGKGNWGEHTNRTHYHSIFNHDQMVEYLKANYDIPVRVIEPHLMTMQEQISAMRNTTILITPSGGVSLIGPFLPVSRYFDL
jgi:hypothetical protein